MILLERRVFLVSEVHAAGALGTAAALVREVKARTSGQRIANGPELDGLKHCRNSP